tara:strand:- start:259 stop:495 length:237 start_codon:yes stop_codon:yes gene_type:complete
MPKTKPQSFGCIPSAWPTQKESGSNSARGGMMQTVNKTCHGCEAKRLKVYTMGPFFQLCNSCQVKWIKWSEAKSLGKA